MSSFSWTPSATRNNLKLHLPENISTVTQYPICKSQEELKRESGVDNPVNLASNENPWGSSPAVAKALSLALAKIHHYPDGSGYSLVRSIALKMGVATNEVVLGNGSSEIVEFLLRIFVDKEGEVITSSPSSLVYKQLVRIYAGKNINVPLRRLTHDLAQIITHITDNTRLIILDNPNNPSGTAMNPRDLYSFLSDIPESVIVVLDEAYVEFLDQEKQLDIFSLIRNTKDRCGVVTIRTFSKAYGLAGLRIGYGIMPSEIAACLQKVRQPFNVNTLAQIASLAALEDGEFLRKTLERTRKGREFLREEVKKLGCTSYPSQANFILIDVKLDAASLYRTMEGKGVVIRPMNPHGLPNCIRVSVGTDEDNMRFLTVLAECLRDLRMPKKEEIITLDGPSGVGKSTISRNIAAALGYTYLDTGAMYRAVGLYLELHQVDIKDNKAVSAGLKDICIQLLPAGNEAGDTGVLLNDEDVSRAIRTPEVSMLASKVSAIPEVRMKLTEMQRKIGAQGRVVAEGRDVGTVVFPNAAHKFFLDADIQERTRRRARQLHLSGNSVEEEKIREMISQRDRGDSERTMAPLRKAEDALLIDTTSITIEDVCARILRVVLPGKSI